MPPAAAPQRAATALPASRLAAPNSRSVTMIGAPGANMPSVGPGSGASTYATGASSARGPVLADDGEKIFG
jgi:hypothetical protein